MFVQGLVQAQNDKDSKTFSDYFTPDATVADEGSSYLERAYRTSNRHISGKSSRNALSFGTERHIDQLIKDYRLSRVLL